MGGGRELPVGWSQALVQAVCGEASAAWPGFAEPGDDFVTHVAALVGESPAEAGLAQLRVPDLYLAFRCAAGDERAVAAFEKQFRTPISSALRRVRSAGHGREDLRQIILRHLLAGPQAAVHSYAGRGSLAGWVGVVAMRVAMNATRGKPRPEDPVDEVADLRDCVQDPELDFLRDRYRADFRSAFEAAVKSLPSRQRRLLHQHMVEKLTVRELGRIYGVNSGTISRWLVAARQALGEGTSEGLRAQLDVTPDELQSIMRMIRSRVDLSLTRALAAGGETGVQ